MRGSRAACSPHVQLPHPAAGGKTQQQEPCADCSHFGEGAPQASRQPATQPELPVSGEAHRPSQQTAAVPGERTEKEREITAQLAQLAWAQLDDFKPNLTDLSEQTTRNACGT